MRKLWERISHIGVHDEMIFEQKRRIVLLNRISMTLFVIVFTLRIVVITMGFQDFSLQSLFPFIGMFLILLIPYFNKLGYYKINAFSFCLIVPVFFVLFSVLSQSMNNTVHINHYFIPRIFIMGSIVLPLVLIDYRDKLLIYIAIGVNIACLLAFDVVVQYIGVPLNPETVSFNNYEGVSLIMLLPILFLILAFVFLTKLNRQYEAKIMALNTDLRSKNTELEDANVEVVSQRDVITEKNAQLEEVNLKVEFINKQLTDGILYAEDIQRAVLNAEELPINYLKDSFILLKPKMHVSGDFYFYKEFLISGKPCLIITVADCTGHGVPGGFLSMLGVSLINEILQNERICNAADVLNLLRERVKKTLNQTGKFVEQKDGMDMALCIYYPDTKTLDYAGAHIPLVIVNSENETQIIKGDRQPIGIYLRENDFTNHRLQFDGGEMIYLFSDGFQDQFGGPEGKKLKFSNLQNKLLELAPLTCEKQKQSIEFFLHDWMFYNNKTDQDQIDDIVMVGMRV